MSFSRRRFLTGVGGATLALPWLEKLQPVARAQGAPGMPRRVIVVSYEMGVPGGAWNPVGTGSNFTLPYVTAPLQPFADRCLFVSNIDHPMLEAGDSTFGHPGKKEAALTGTLTTQAFPASNNNQLSEILASPNDEGAANGPSVEQLIGEHLRGSHSRPSVDLGVDGNAGLGSGNLNTTQESSFFFESKGNPTTLTLAPDAAFTELFGALLETGPSEEELARQRLHARNKSVLDAVRASFNDMRQGLARADQQRLDDHAARIRQLEIDIQVSDSCVIPGTITPVANWGGYHMGQLSSLQMRNLAHAMACDLAPVGRVQFINQQDPRFGIADLDGLLDSTDNYQWHDMVHGDPLPNTTTVLRPGRDDQVTEYDPRLLAGYRFFVEQFAALLSELDSIQEGPETTALDHTMVVLASDLGEGLGHAHMKMGYILAGNLGGARTGFHFNAGPDRQFGIGGQYYYDPSPYNVNQLLNSMLDMAGVVDGSGSPVTMGLGGFLENAGLSRRIDGLFG